MTNETKESQEKIINKEFPVIRRGEAGPCRHRSNGDLRAEMLESIVRKCAKNSARFGSEDNSMYNCVKEYGMALLKTGTLAATLYGGFESVQYVREQILPGINSCEPEENAGLKLVAYPVIALGGILLAKLIKKQIVGSHPVSAYNTYIAPPFFGVLDHLKIANGWKKIARLQKQGILEEGKREEFATKDCYAELGRNFGGGP